MNFTLFNSNIKSYGKFAIFSLLKDTITFLHHLSFWGYKYNYSSIEQWYNCYILETGLCQIIAKMNFTLFRSNIKSYGKFAIFSLLKDTFTFLHHISFWGYKYNYSTIEQWYNCCILETGLCQIILIPSCQKQCISVRRQMPGHKILHYFLCFRVLDRVKFNRPALS